MSPTFDKQSNWLINNPKYSEVGVLLGHGSGAGMSHLFMESLAAELAENQCLVVRFNFEYMQKSLASGRRRPPDRLPKLQEFFQRQYIAVRTRYPNLKWVVAGKSMAGRVACSIADRIETAALAFGYPFHPVKKPEATRLEPLQHCRQRRLVVQGTRDRLGNKEEVCHYPMAENVTIHWLADGDHDFQPRKASGFTQSDHIAAAAARAAAFCLRHE